jgi:predicted AlkP superfamily phosphohydrolase/phosphomutase
MTRTLLIGLDGGTFAILNPLVQEGVMPFLKSVIDDGVRADLLSTANPLTPPAWVSVMTGRSPGYHGVMDFIRATEHQQGCYLTLITSLDVRCETIWSMASRNGLRVACLNFIATSPPLPINGYLIPGFTTSRVLKMTVYPPKLYDQLKAIPGFSAKDMAWDLEHARKHVIYQQPEHEYEDFVRYYMERERQWFSALRHLMVSDPCELTAIVFDGVDKLQHALWRFLDPELFPKSASPWESRIRTLCWDYFRELDGYLAEMVRLAGPDARVIIVSDHGFGPSQDIFYANTWLEQHGYLKWKPEVPQDGSYDLVARDVKGHFEGIDWERTRAYTRTPSSNGIHIRTASRPGQSGVPLSEYQAFRARLMKDLLESRDPATGDPIVDKILTREEAFPGPFMTQAPDLTLMLRDWACISVLNASHPLKRRPDLVGVHRPEGIFIATGSGFRKGAVLSPTSILNVAPMVLHSCGLPVPEDLEGEVVAEAYEPDFLRSQPVRRGARTRGAKKRPGEAVEVAAEEEAQVIERLKGLGYLE